MSSEQYTLKKLVWSDADFEQMGWHDACIHAVATLPENFELLFDIDYIIHWVVPTLLDQNYKFWVAPATLIFENVSNLEFNWESHSGEIVIQDLNRTDEQKTPNGAMTDWQWNLNIIEGDITFRATGYKQYFRRQPSLTPLQKLRSDE
jgi:hypothetical protein